MIRLFAPVGKFFFAIALKLLFQGEVSVTVDAPAEVVAGTEFEVRINVKKGDMTSFSRLYTELPAGLKAESSIIANSDFSFEDKRARFIWLRMPDDETITVAYKVKIDQRLKGTFNIDGKFSYIDNNERRSVNVSSPSITITPSPDIDPSLVVDLKDYEQMVIPYIPGENSDPLIACIRETPKPAPDGEGFIVNLLVSKERKERFAKIEEQIPRGYKAQLINEHDAIFTFKNNTAKFLWMNLPSSSFFTVSYRLVPIVRKNIAPPLSGQFSYLEEAKTISIDIKQTARDLAMIQTPEELNNLLLTIDDEQLAQTVQPENATNTVTENGTGTTTEPDNQTTTRTITPTRQNKEPRSNAKFNLEAEDGIYYRVQLAAGHEPVNIRRYFRKYKLEREVRREIHEGWHKYSIGSFGVYKEARDYRVKVWETTVIDDAFVSAYNNGTRITVQEALMISNQDWYR